MTRSNGRCSNFLEKSDNIVSKNEVASKELVDHGMRDLFPNSIEQNVQDI
jgi:hypothetical protein